MGSPGGLPTEGLPEEELLHRVTLTQPFYLGVYEVTQLQYVQVMGASPSKFKGPRNPVERVSWDKAAEFCRRLSELPKEKVAGRVYRLPTEAEWEYACRAGTSTMFNTGEKLTKQDALFADNRVGWAAKTAPVGTYPPNAWGLFDMHGNVWEWTNDWFSQSYYRKSPVKDPLGPARGTHHTLRGGSASVQSHECYSAVRGEARLDKPDPNGLQRFGVIGDFGFRVVCEF